MFKTLCAYLLGFFAGFFVFTQVVMQKPNYVLLCIVVVLLTFILAQTISAKVHKRMQREHYELYRNGKRG